jgi:hypothetical protein
MIEHSPGPRASHTAIIVSKSILIIGGRDGEGHVSLSDIYALVIDEGKNIIRYREDLQDIESMKREMEKYNITVPPIPPDRTNSRFHYVKHNYFELEGFPRRVNS